LDGVNNIIQLLPRKDRVRILAVCEPVLLTIGNVLGEMGSTTRHVYFPTTAVISLIMPVDDTLGIEVAMVGNEGMLGTHLMLGTSTEPLRMVIQGSGFAMRLGSTAFRRELATNSRFLQFVQRYLSVRMAQMASSAVCMHVHLIKPRLARWLLMTQDRTSAERFHVTHESLGSMLGVRRVGVTMAAGLLQRHGLIQYSRGEVIVIDRAGLEAQACSCYESDRALYASAMH
jgi:hypothetical protein